MLRSMINASVYAIYFQRIIYSIYYFISFVILIIIIPSCSKLDIVTMIQLSPDTLFYKYKIGKYENFI